MRCPRVAEWRAEKARADQREKLTASITAWTEEKARSELRDKLKSEVDKASASRKRTRTASTSCWYFLLYSLSSAAVDLLSPLA